MINCDNLFMNLEKERLLVIAPHADDETLGCFGLINKVKQNGGKVFVQILTMGGYSKIGYGRVKKETWKNEFNKVMKFLDVDGFDIAFYDNNIKHLDTMAQADLIELVESKSNVSISKIKPTIVAIPTIFSTHQDHVQAYRITLSALRPHPQKTTFLPKLVVSYESPEYYFWSAYSEFGTFSPNFYLQMSHKEIQKKVQALNFYKTQLRTDQRDGNHVIALADIRGSEIGTTYAEAYHIHRIFI